MQQRFVNDNSHTAKNDGQYSNINLNQNQKCFDFSPDQTCSKSYNHKYSDSAVSDKYEEKKKLQSLHNPSKEFTALKSNNKVEKEWEKSWKKDDSSSITSKSTLSLHIASYEKLSDIEASNLFDDKNNADLKVEIFGSNKNERQIVTTASSFNVQNPFEFPRQQNDKASEPELSQFRTSQRLLNLNEISNNGQQSHQQQQSAAHLLHQRAIAAQHLPQQPPPLQYLPAMGSRPLQQESNTAMFPRKNSSLRSSEEYRNRPNTSRDFGRRRDDRNRQNDYRRDSRRDDRRSSYNDRDRYRRTSPLPSGRGFGFETRCENTYEQNRERKRRLDAEEENAILRKKLEDSEREKKLEEEALSQRFCPHGDSDSSDAGGGAPIFSVKKKDKKKKKKRHGSSDSSSSSCRDIKRSRYSDDDEEFEKYEFLPSLYLIQPKIFTQTAPEKTKTRPPDFENRRKTRKTKLTMDAKKLRTDTVEYLFPPKEPSEKEPGVFDLEEAPYDIVNSASTSIKEEIDWESLPYEDFAAMEITKQNIFSQSSASKKILVYNSRLRNAASIKEKIDCYLNIVNLEDERVEESRKSGSLTGKFDTNSVKLSKISEAIRDCGESVDLRLLEIDILTKTKGEQSDDVKKAWQKCMNLFPNDLKMWRRRLTYYRNKRSVFNASSYIKDSILPCLDKLGGILNQTFVSHSKQEGTEEFIIDVIVAAATFYIELGSTSKAIGILQALVEFYFLVPQQVKTSFSFQNKLKAFEYYWQTPIAKAGHADAFGWYKVTPNASYTKYDYPKNFLLDAEAEKQEFQGLCKRVFDANTEYCKNDRIHSDCERLSKVEQYRTEHFWEPLYNSETKPVLFKQQYNSFSDIKPYLMQLPKKIVEQTVFKILTKLGAVFPNVIDYSQEAIFRRCHVRLVDQDFKMKYDGMRKFVDNILILISGAEKETFLYATIARLMTSKAFLLDNNPPSTFLEANSQFLNDVRRIYQTSIRKYDGPEGHIVDSYITELTNEIFLHYEKDVQNPLAANEKSLLPTIKNIFDPSIEKPQLLAYIRYCVMLCRNLPHYADDAAELDLLTKLKLLMKISFPTEKINYESKEMQQKAIKRWQNIKLHENEFNLPPGSGWIGDINSYALELFSTLCYEIEIEPSLKIAAFREFYSKNILERNEDLTEMFFKTWDRHLNHYYEEKTSFMIELKSFIDIFPRNDTLTLMYVANLQQNEIETRGFFLLNRHEDDVVKVLRCAIQLATEFENIYHQRLISTRKTNNRYFLEILKESAELSLTNLIPESFLWRSVLFFVKHTKKTDFHNTFLIANDQCPWSKILLTYAASLSSTRDFVEEIEEHARKAGIKLLTSLEDLEELVRPV